MSGTNGHSENVFDYVNKMNFIVLQQREKGTNAIDHNEISKEMVKRINEDPITIKAETFKEAKSKYLEKIGKKTKTTGERESK